MVTMTSPAIPRNQTQRAKIIAGFPGVGKSYFCNYCIPTHGPLAAYKFFDLEPDNFQNIGEAYPQNYIDRIRVLAEAANTVLLIDTDPTVRQTLLDKGYKITLVYPQVAHKNVYMKRYRDMHRDPHWISDFDADWENYMANLMEQKNCNHRVLRNAQNIQGVLEDIVINERDNPSDFRRPSDGGFPNGDRILRGGPNDAGVRVHMTDTRQTITIPGQAPIIISTQRIQDPLSRISIALFTVLLFMMVFFIVLLESERKVYVAANNGTRVRVLDTLELWLETERANLV